jgi:hypothetical protein
LKRALGSVAFAIAVVVGCGSDDRDLFVVQHDAGADGGDAGAGPDAEAEVDPTLGGPCTEDAQCEDDVPCTSDRCDKTLSRCRNTPDDSLCQDDSFCNGKERCVLRRGCAPGPVVTCQDDNPCTIDRCIEATKGCEHLPRDVDGDGDPDDHCVATKDCDDSDPTVSSTRSEVCGNFKDDDCDGSVDEQPCVVPANDQCATALAVTAPGTYLLTTAATKKDYAATCSVKTPAAARDIVVKITVPAGEAKNVLVGARGYGPPNEVAVAMQTTCGQAASEVGCGNTPGISDARAIARNVQPGESVYAIVTTQAESSLDVKVDLLPAEGKPGNESCAAPMPVALETPFTASLVDPGKDLASDCDKATTGELTYQFDLPSERDVRIFTSTTAGSGKAVVSLRDATCTDELRCRVSGALPAFARRLAAGTHVFSVAGTSQIDANVLVKTYAPTDPPATQTCATAPAIAANATTLVDLGSHEDAIKNGCLPGGPTAAYRLDLPVESDVLAIGRFAQNELGAVSINRAGCTTADVLACVTGQTPVRAARRKLAAGSYWIVVADELGQTAQLDVLVRPYAAPTSVTTADGCTDAITIPEAGGFFTGDNQGAKADFDASCDAPGLPFGGAPDRLLKLVLGQKRRVVFDMSGSVFTTVLDIRQGATCPGSEVANGCYAGFGASKSFLDLRLDPGTYWVQLDGYAGDYGQWNLDVRTLPP